MEAQLVKSMVERENERFPAESLARVLGLVSGDAQLRPLVDEADLFRGDVTDEPVVRDRADGEDDVSGPWGNGSPTDSGLSPAERCADLRICTSETGERGGISWPPGGMKNGGRRTGFASRLGSEPRSVRDAGG